jgi:hypothetical protein
MASQYFASTKECDMIGTTTAAVIMRNCVPACGACKVGRLRDSRSEVFNGDPKEI